VKELQVVFFFIKVLSSKKMSKP